MYGASPSVAIAVAVPSLALQFVGSVVFADTVGDPNPVRVMDAAAMQLLPSLTVTE